MSPSSTQCFSLLATILFWQRSIAINVLGIFSLPLKSHYMAFKPLLEELASRGHSVTVISHFPNDEPLRNFKDIPLTNYDNIARKIMPMSFYEPMGSYTAYMFNFYRHLVFSPEVTETDCETLFTDKAVKEHIAGAAKYDVIFVEQFSSDCSLVFAATHHDAPIIGITSHVLLPWTYSKLGLPFDYSSDASYFLESGQNPSLFRKIEAFVLHSYYNTIGRWNSHEKIYEAFRKYRPGIRFDAEQIGKERMKMVFTYQHFSLTGARLLAPQLLEIGGLHIKRPKPLPEDIERYINDAEHGVIYVSFGSNLKSSTMSDEKRKVFLDAFEKIPQKVIWKWENESMDIGSDHILTRQWLPQLDVLCHPKVIGFVSHCGMLGTSEAAHCGVPTVSMPFFGDQFGNAAIVRDSGLGRVLHFQSLTSEGLLDALNNITSEQMQDKAKEISKLWHDRPMPVLDSAIYWTEYVARYKTALPSLPSKHTSYFQYLLLDVYFVLLALILIILFIVYLVLRILKVIILQLLDILNVGKKAKCE